LRYSFTHESAADEAKVRATITTVIKIEWASERQVRVKQLIRYHLAKKRNFSSHRRGTSRPLQGPLSEGGPWSFLVLVRAGVCNESADV
jgi:hypothetical protein